MRLRAWACGRAGDPVARAWGTLRGTAQTWGDAPYPGSVVIDQKDAGLNKSLVVLFPDDL